MAARKDWEMTNLQRSAKHYFRAIMTFNEISTSGRFAWKQKTEGPNFRKAPLENLRGGSARHVAEAWMLEALSWKCHRIQGESLTNLMSPCVSLRVWNFEGWIVADSERY